MVSSNDNLHQADTLFVDTTASLSATAGVSLKPKHFDDAAQCRAEGIWFEVHPENYMMPGGPRLAGLQQVANHHPLSFHGVGASLGGPTPPDPKHLAALRRLMDRFQPASVSEHAVWSYGHQQFFADLLPLQRTQAALRQLVDGIDRYQTALGRRILIENPTNYLPFVAEMDEASFLVEAAQRSGCGILLDVNNLFLSAHNTNLDPDVYVRQLPPTIVGEIHIAGHTADPEYGDALLIDSHDAAVSANVWALLRTTLQHLGPKPTLLERDAMVPSFQTLMNEVLQISTYLADARL